MELSKGFQRKVIKTRENYSNTTEALKSRVSTLPLKSGGASFKTNVLIEESRSKLVYKPSIGVALFCFLFFAVGFGLLFFGIYPLFGNGSNLAELKWILILVGFIFTSAGGLMFYFFYMPRVFDKQLGIYYQTYKSKIYKTKKDQSHNYIPLKTIIAIQLIGEHIRSNKGSYKSFELNLVLEDGSRKNVVDHGSLKSIIIDAEVISTFLNIPIWHAKSNEG